MRPDIKSFKSTKYGILSCKHTQRSSREPNKFEVNKNITKEEAIIIQIKMGYHPAGYCFGEYTVSGDTTTWECFNSCD